MTVEEMGVIISANDFNAREREREQSRYRHLYTEGNTVTQRPRNALTYCTTKV